MRKPRGGVGGAVSVDVFTSTAINSCMPMFSNSCTLMFIEEGNQKMANTAQTQQQRQQQGHRGGPKAKDKPRLIAARLRRGNGESTVHQSVRTGGQLPETWAEKKRKSREKKQTTTAAGGLRAAAAAGAAAAAVTAEVAKARTLALGSQADSCS